MNKRKHVNYVLPNFLTPKRHLTFFLEFWYLYDFNLAQEKYCYSFKILKPFESTGQFLIQSNSTEHLYFRMIYLFYFDLKLNALLMKLNDLALFFLCWFQKLYFVYFNYIHHVFITLAQTHWILLSSQFHFIWRL